MRIAFALYKYFPYGGLARDFVRIADMCLQKGYRVDVYVMEWHGERMAGYHPKVLSCKGLTNHAKVSSCHQQLADQLKKESYDVVVGFNKIPNLDVLCGRSLLRRPVCKQMLVTSTESTIPLLLAG